MKLSFEDMLIRNAEDADVPFYAMWWNDGEVMAYAGFPKGLNTTLQKVAEIISRDNEKSSMHLVAEIGGRPVGEMSYKISGDIAEIGIKICDKDYRDRGYGKKLLSMLIAELFKRGAQKIVLGTNYLNKRARAVYSRLGFKEVEIRRDSWLNQLGEPQTTVYCELLPQEFVSFCPDYISAE